MAAKNIIKTYHLEDRIRTLKVQGLSDEQIANKLNAEDLSGKDSISQPTISRWIKKDRKLRAKTAQTIVDDYMTESIPADLKLLDEITAFHLNVFRAKVTLKEKDGSVIEASNMSFNDRRTAARDIHAIVQTKMRFVGVGVGPDDLDADSPVDLSQFRTDLEDKAVNDD
jgi:hypothetical protein